MGNRSYTQQPHHRFNHTSKTFFLPMLCRPSAADVDAKFTNLSSSDSSPAPVSPKISCTGQIKKRSITATTYHLTATRTSGNTNNSATNLTYTRLRKLLSGKNLISRPDDAAKISNHGSKRVSSGHRTCNRSTTTTRSISSEKNHVISVEDLDPPLPVVKLCPRDRKVNVNLGKRRGIELKTLQIQPFQLSTAHCGTKMIDNRKFSLRQTSRDESDQCIR